MHFLFKKQYFLVKKDMVLERTQKGLRATFGEVYKSA